MDFAVPAVLIIDLEINPKTDTVFKIGAYRPDLDLGFERSFRHEEGFRKALEEMLPLARYRYAEAVAARLSAKPVPPPD